MHKAITYCMLFILAFGPLSYSLGLPAPLSVFHLMTPEIALKSQSLVSMGKETVAVWQRLIIIHSIGAMELTFLSFG